MVANICIQIGPDYCLFSWEDEGLLNVVRQSSKVTLTVLQKAHGIVGPAD